MYRIPGSLARVSSLEIKGPDHRQFKVSPPRWLRDDAVKSAVPWVLIRILERG
jgi:hypothetical protein